MTLDMKTWTWQRTTYNNDTEVVPNEIEAFTLTFNEDGTYSGTTDCNSFNGSYTLEGSALTFGPPIATLMFLC